MNCYYFQCDTVHGKHIIGIKALHPMDAEQDLKRIILEPAERIIKNLKQKPRGFTWEAFRKPWAIIGTK